MTPEELRPVGSQPALYTLAKFMQRNGVRGGYRLEKTLLKRGHLNVDVRHKLPNGVEIDIPLAERTFDSNYLAGYESESIEQIAPIISRYASTFCLLDCGADIGLMSAKFVSSIPAIGRVMSFEPSRIPFLHLEKNARLLGIEATALNMGLADFKGTARLEAPDFDSHDHAAFVVPSEDGDFEVTTIDELGLGADGGLFLKIDVEGAELAVLQGASETIEWADHLVVLFEAHPEHVRRTGVDPVEIIDFVTSIRECEAVVVEMPDRTIDRARPFFDQFPDRIVNICLHSTSDASAMPEQRTESHGEVDRVSS